MDYLKIKSLTVNCDASFFEEFKQGIIAFVISDEKGNTIYKKNKKISCKTSSEAEYRAIGMAVKWLNFYQKTNLMRNRIYINIIGDSKSVIEYVNNSKLKKCDYVDKILLAEYNAEIDKLKDNNKVRIIWQKRENNKVADQHTRARCLFAMA